MLFTPMPKIFSPFKPCIALIRISSPCFFDFFCFFASFSLAAFSTLLSSCNSSPAIISAEISSNSLTFSLYISSEPLLQHYNNTLHSLFTYLWICFKPCYFFITHCFDLLLNILSVLFSVIFNLLINFLAS